MAQTEVAKTGTADPPTTGQNYIAGEWKGARDGATDDVVDPATGEVIATAPASGEADVDDAVTAARAAFDDWAGRTPRQRSEVLHRVADAIEANMDELRTIECRNVGKPVSIIEFEMDLTLDNWRFFASAGRFLEGKAARQRESWEEAYRLFSSALQADPSLAWARRYAEEARGRRLAAAASAS